MEAGPQAGLHFSIGAQFDLSHDSGKMGERNLARHGGRCIVLSPAMVEWLTR